MLSSSLASMVSSGECVTDVVGTDKLLTKDAGSHALEQVSDSKIHLSQSDRGGATPSIKSEKRSLPNSLDKTSQSVQGGNVSPMISGKTSLTPDTIPSSLPAKEGSTPIGREKALEDGYSWRKYGQKLVKGNEFIRSYYKCTHPNCRVKKQLERSHDGKMVDTVYFGHHDHPMPLNLPLAVGFVVSVVEEKPNNASPIIAKDKSFNAHIQTPSQVEQTDDPQPLAVVTSDNVKGTPAKSNRIQNVGNCDDDHLMSKRRKKENSNADASPVQKPTTESRWVVKTHSEVDIVNDGFRWRKYGQKLVKGNPNPRSYYRCSNPGCPVKKHVERASHDVKLVITTYEGRHNHDMPPTRTVTHNTTGVNVHSIAPNDDSGTKVEESETACLDMVVHSGSGPENKSGEQLNGESTIKSDVVDIPVSGPESGPNGQQSGKFDPCKESDPVGHDMIVHSESSSRNTSNEQLNNKVEMKSENDTVCIDKMVHITPRADRNFDEQRMPSAEPVQS